MSPGGRLERADRALAAALRGISVVCLAALFLTISFVVITRIFGLRSAGWTDELIELAFGWLLFPCAASLWRTKSHFTVDLLEQTIASPAVRRALAIAVEALCLVFLAVFFYEACVFVEASVSESSPVFGISRAWWYGVMPIAGAIMMVYSFARLVAAVRGRVLALT
jgi:TRAP-type C4-dicarboxylate transport system permease small subunit